MSKRNFRGAVVLITGGAGGIGLALARRFLAEGAEVAIADLAGERLDAVSTVTTGAAADGLDGALALACDVTSPERCVATVDAVLQRWGRLDVLVNNAGIVHRSAFADTELDVYRRLMDVNVLGAINMTKAALASIRSARGVLITTSSIAGFSPLLGRTGYSASKHALHGFFDSLRPELRPDGVDVMIVCPSFTDTGFESRTLGGDGAISTRPRTMVGKLMNPDDVAEAVVEGAKRRRERLVLSTIGKLSWWISRFSPALFERLMTRSLGGAVDGGPGVKAERP